MQFENKVKRAIITMKYVNTTATNNMYNNSPFRRAIALLVHINEFNKTKNYL